jgi:raffinose/stachyose/melibiose transport system permease protein
LVNHLVENSTKKRKFLVLFSKKKKKFQQNAPGAPKNIAYVYLIPALLFFLLFTGYPVISAIWISFFEWDGLTLAKWVGLNNYINIFSDPAILSAFKHAIILIIFYSFIPVSIAILVAGLVSKNNISGFVYIRSMLFLPQIFAMLIIGTTWKWIYSPDGVLNSFFIKLGFENIARPWLGDFNFALPALGVVGSWLMIGLASVFLIAGAQKIPSELYEASAVDGANQYKQFFVVTIPGIKREIGIALVLTTLAALKNFDLVYSTTFGGPGRQTVVPGFLVYFEAFRVARVGMGAAIGVMLAILIFLLVFVITKVADRENT